MEWRHAYAPRLMAYTVFARKYRPQTFDELVGQEHVARTLAGAIEADRVAHAFLFTGVRGVGKTTTARLLAKALCCEKGPTPTPCNECDPCKDITAGVDIDVQEIDGASNNGVDDVRRLQESLPFRPARDRFKIVIVDEVHMLSTGAFNAFLKTLEEPPSHVKFIFATTESHKVPITIRSRCQRHDFRLIPQATIAERVKTVLDSEGVVADEAAIGIVSREAAGSMRDALTLLDQLVASSAGELRGEQVTSQLGIAARDSIHGVVRGVLDGDGKTVLELVDSATSRGADPLHLTQQLVRLLRDLVVIQTAGVETELVQLVREERDAANALVSGHDPLTVQRAFASIAKLTDEVAKASSPRMALEMGLVRLATRPPLVGLATLMQRLDRLEGGGGGGGGGSSSGSPRGGGGSSTRGPSSASSRAHGSSHSAAPAVGEDTVPPAGSPPTTQSGGSVEQRPKEPGPPHPTVAFKPPSSTQTAPTKASDVHGSASAPGGAADAGEGTGSKSAQAVPVTQESVESSLRSEVRRSVEPKAGFPAEPRSSFDMSAADQTVHHTSDAHEGRHDQPETQRSVGEASPGPSVAQTDRDHQSGAIRRPAMQEWEAFVDALRDGKPALAAVLEHGVPRVVSPEKIVLSFQEGSFYGRQADARASREAILDVAESRLGVRPPIEIRYDSDLGASTRTVAAVEATRRDAEIKQRRKDALAHPVVRDAMQVFSESTGRVRVRLDSD